MVALFALLHFLADFILARPLKKYSGMEIANPLLQVTEIELVYRNKVKASDRIKVANADAAYDVFMAHWNMDTIELVEEFKILLLNRNNKVLGLVNIGVGGINCVLVDVRIVMAACLKAAATSLICCHNHPSGNLTPSNHDKEFTKKLLQAGELLDIKLNDHIIITKEGYCSIEDHF